MDGSRHPARSESSSRNTSVAWKAASGSRTRASRITLHAGEWAGAGSLGSLGSLLEPTREISQRLLIGTVLKRRNGGKQTPQTPQTPRRTSTVGSAGSCRDHRPARPAADAL